MEEQVKKWRNDPNHIGIFPIPIGYQELGGNARALMLTPEMKFLEDEKKFDPEEVYKGQPNPTKI